jgi:hypothetical protein
MPLKKPSRATRVGLLLALAVFCVYLATLSRTIGWEDSGEIATSLYTLGIVHPTGYPTFTLMGWAFSHLPLGGRVIWRLNLMVAILTAVSVFFYFRLFLFLLSEKARVLFPGFNRKSSGVTSSESTDETINLWAAGLATFILAFSRTFWSEALSVEVYSFHLLLVAIITLLFLKALTAEATNRPSKNRDWRLFAFALGFAFTNHLMTVLLAPAFLLLLIQVTGFGKRARTKILQAVPLFVAGLLPYLYLYVRAGQKPLMNWGDPSTLQGLWTHVTGGQYREHMFEATSVASRKLVDFVRGFPEQFAILPLIFGVAGIFMLWKNNRRQGVFAGLLFLVCVGYAVNYDFEDPNYYLNAYVAFALVMAWGIKGLLTLARRPDSTRLWIPALAFSAAVAATPLLANYRDMDLSQDSTIEDYTRNMLQSMDTGGVLFAREEQIFMMPSIYLQVVEGVRPDVGVINVLWLSMPWFHDFLEVRAPWALDRAQAARRPTYATMGTALRENVRKIPEGMVWRLALDSTPETRTPATITFQPILGNNVYKDWIRSEYARAFYNQGVYRGLMRGDTATGAFYFQKTLSMIPGYPPALEGLRLLQRTPGGG